MINIQNRTDLKCTIRYVLHIYTPVKSSSPSRYWTCPSLQKCGTLGNCLLPPLPSLDILKNYIQKCEMARYVQQSLAGGSHVGTWCWLVPVHWLPAVLANGKAQGWTSAPNTSPGFRPLVRCVWGVCVSEQPLDHSRGSSLLWLPLHVLLCLARVHVQL